MHMNDMHYEGTSTKQVGVHKKDAEGILMIDALTGHVITDQHDRPEWAEGLVLAQLAERHLWYTNRLGAVYSDEHKSPELFAFEDLGWLGTREVAEHQDPETGEWTDQEEFVLAADDEFRMEILAQVTGINRDADAQDPFASVENVVAEAEIAMDNQRTTAEMEDFRTATDAGFEDVRKTGTNGH